ncbi:16S rRNA (guanine(1207)-N(2))-methyltransferase RsmC [Affinibrenneria salicis]|uniref:Ribosomal RNA small subunit methyltransferase C n=1 Tax=Affinibrenneria salicis TaxID=2590031 RepID=A0A5J5G8J7_9GAMM|nr:16S rRNA (guanine(1207)-N(2))-methyltransferase RsmC [Affinibrenneria salicis]KAA9002708.1 16S rRNA (guanine(1207)-N(2))-methyltransferase RsmC [Affinibrenneria salicis]KAA9003005.1 16S rRNA (guanine(1207)-N(2))-methyltransferase RsmC [Affinibrenneria salicis]
MSAFTPASEVILRHSDEFSARRVLFAGDLQDTLPASFEAAEVRAHTMQYHHWQQLQRAMGDRAQFALLADADTVAGCDTLIYYWPKSKQEAQFQLFNLLSLLPVGCEIFVIGENRSGVRSAETLLAEFASLNKIDSARRCGLYHGRLDKSSGFTLDDWWQEYDVDGVPVLTLPGVFSRDGLDNGSQLLLSTLEAHSKGKVLDIACGAGVLAAAFAHRSPKIRLTLSDVNAAALEASRATLALNQLEGEVIASNVYSDIGGRFDLIISNPPFHDGLQTSLQAAEMLIRGAAAHLNIGGQLRIVANAFLPYPALLDDTFGSHEVLAQTGRFRVYKAVLARAAKKRA